MAMTQLIAANPQTLTEFITNVSHASTNLDMIFPLQNQIEQLMSELVPAGGMANTIEGECLRAAKALMHDGWWNGFANNTSGALCYLHQHFNHPAMNELYRTLKTRVSGGEGEGGYSEVQYLLLEVGKSVLATSNRTPNETDWSSLTVRAKQSNHHYFGD